MYICNKSKYQIHTKCHRNFIWRLHQYIFNLFCHSLSTLQRVNLNFWYVYKYINVILSTINYIIIISKFQGTWNGYGQKHMEDYHKQWINNVGFVTEPPTSPSSPWSASGSWTCSGASLGSRRSSPGPPGDIGTECPRPWRRHWRRHWQWSNCQQQWTQLESNCNSGLEYHPETIIIHQVFL